MIVEFVNSSDMLYHFDDESNKGVYLINGVIPDGNGFTLDGNVHRDIIEILKRNPDLNSLYCIRQNWKWRVLDENEEKNSPLYVQPRITSLVQLQKLQKEWAEHNFPNAGNSNGRNSFKGVVEEVGELSHALLKQSQGIRGTSDEHEHAGKDAVGDIVIYWLDFCNRKNVIVQEPQIAEEYRKDIDIDDVFLSIIIAQGKLAEVIQHPASERQFYHFTVNDFLGCLVDFCVVKGWDFWDCVNQAWDEIKDRDWIKFPKNGRTE